MRHRAWPTWLLLIGVLSLGGCRYQPLQRARGEQFVSEAGQVLFKGPGFDVVLRLDCDRRSAEWLFRNRGSTTLVFSHQHLQLHHEESGNSYYLWGLPWRENQTMPPIDVKPGTFIALQYTMPVHGGFRHFCDMSGSTWRLHMVVDRKDGARRWEKSKHNVLLWSASE